MRQASTAARLISLALVLGVLVLHVPLDAFRSPDGGLAPRIDACVATGCCPGSVAEVGDREDCAPHAGVDEDAVPPMPKDGCDAGCHCGCCGGFPLAAETSHGPVGEAPGAPTRALDRPGVRRSRPLEVFHPPRA